MATFLGIDPGLAAVGFGVVSGEKSDFEYQDCGIIKTPAKMPIGERLVMIKDDILDLLDEFKPDAVGIEELFFVKNVTNGLKVAQARGVLVEEITRRGIPLFEFKPNEIKQNITGDGAADKKSMQIMVKRLLKLSHAPRPDDAADAVGIAILTGRVFKQSPV